MAEFIVRGWFVARCCHTAGQQRPNSGEKACEWFKNISSPIFLFIMTMFFSAFNTFFFFVVMSNFDMEMFSMASSYKVLFFRAELSMVVSSTGGNQYPPLTWPFSGSLGSCCHFPCSPPQKWQGMWQLTQWSSSPSLPQFVRQWPLWAYQTTQTQHRRVVTLPKTLQ